MTPPAGGSVQYGWDNAGRLARITHRAGKVYTVTQAYDAAGRLTGITDWLNKTTTYGYDDAGRLTGIAYPNGVASAYAYDPAGRLAGVSHAKGGSVLAGVAYTLDPAGNRTAVAETGVPLPGTTTYTYDAADRLVGAAYPDGSTAGWGYDPVGNRTGATLNGATTSASYDAANRLTAQGGATFAHDASGNRTGKTEGGVTTTYTYDAENRLTGVGGPGGPSASYAYDGDGHRVRKTVNGAATTYAWDHLGAGGLGTVIGDGQAGYVHGPAGLQQRVAVGTTAPRYAHADGLGSLRLVTDPAGAKVSTSTYEPWGTPRSGSQTLGGFGFAGEQQDAESGLLYLRVRHYDPAAGRFLQPDSYLGRLDAPASLHRYAYVRGNPVNYVDPSGYSPADEDEPETTGGGGARPTSSGGNAGTGGGGGITAPTHYQSNNRGGRGGAHAGDIYDPTTGKPLRSRHGDPKEWRAYTQQPEPLPEKLPEQPWWARLWNHIVGDPRE